MTGAITSSEHLCAGGVLGEDACKGDSGGPLLARTDDQSSWQLVGIVSGGSARSVVVSNRLTSSEKNISSEINVSSEINIGVMFLITSGVVWAPQDCSPR